MQAAQTLPFHVLVAEKLVVSLPSGEGQAEAPRPRQRGWALPPRPPLGSERESAGLSGRGLFQKLWVTSCGPRRLLPPSWGPARCRGPGAASPFPHGPLGLVCDLNPVGLCFHRLLGVGCGPPTPVPGVWVMPHVLPTRRPRRGHSPRCVGLVVGPQGVPRGGHSNPVTTVLAAAVFASAERELAFEDFGNF